MQWLVHPADAGSNLAKGAAAGAQIAESYQRGVGLAQRQMEMERNAAMQQEELNMRMKLFPLQQTLQQQQADMNALRIEQGLKARNASIANDKAWGGLSGAVNEKLQSGDLAGARTAFIAGNSSNPNLWIDPRSEQLGKQLEQMGAKENAVKIANIRAQGVELRGQPADVKIQRGLQQAQRDLLDLQESGASDDALAAAATEVKSWQDVWDLHRQKVENDKNRQLNESDRIAATNERTKAIRANTDRLNQQLGSLDRVAMNQEIRVVQDAPNSSFTDKTKSVMDQKLDRIAAIHEKYGVRARKQIQPKGDGESAAPQNEAAPAPDTSAMPKPMVPAGTVLMWTPEGEPKGVRKDVVDKYKAAPYNYRVEGEGGEG